MERAAIRIACNRDREGVVSVIRAVFDEYSFTWEEDGYHADLYDLDAHYHRNGHVFWVAELDSAVVGTVALERFPRIQGVVGSLTEKDGFVRVGGCDCALARMYVHPSARRQGIGAVLVQTLLDAAHEDRRHAMELWSDKRFGDAHRLYSRFGARIVGERICHDPDQSPEWGLMIPLAP